MKHTKFILTLGIIAGMSCGVQAIPANSQYGGSTWSSDFGVGVLRIGTRYTQSQVKAALGKSPTTYRSHTSEFGLSERYYYGENYFQFAENGIFVGFSVETNDYTVFEQYKGGIKVGNTIANLKSLKLRGTLELSTTTAGEYKLTAGDSVVYFTVSGSGDSAKITSIYYSESV
jgi:hypothetical protein